jgi:hypothetical protein
MRRLNRFMEHFWLAVFIGTTIVAVWMIVQEGFAEARSWLWFPAIALAMFLFRRITARRLEAMDQRHRQRQG